jgi:hypothetical protein
MKCLVGPYKFTPHFAKDRDTGTQNYDAKSLDSSKRYAETLGTGAYVVQITEDVVAQY